MQSNFAILEKINNDLYNSVIKIEKNIGITYPNFPVDMRRVIEGYIEYMYPKTNNKKLLGKKIDYLEERQSLTNNAIQHLRESTNILNVKIHNSQRNGNLDYSKRINLLKTLHIVINENSKTEEFNENIYQNYELELFDPNSKATEYFNDLKSKLENDNNFLKNCDVFSNFCAAHLMNTDDVSYISRVKPELEEDGINQFFYDDDNDAFRIGKSFYDTETTDEQIRDCINQIKMTLQIFAENNDYSKSEAFSISKEEFCSRIENCSSLDIYVFSVTKFDEKIYTINWNKTISEIKKMLNSLNDELNVFIHIVGYEDIVKHFNEIDNNSGLINQKLTLVNKNSIIEMSDIGFYVCVIKGESLKKLFDNHHDFLFEKNVRGYIKNKKIDTEITSTIQSRPSDFLKLNNGITIVAKRVVHDGVVVKFDEMFIVNGAQTTSLIGQSDSKLEGLRVLTKIIEVNDVSKWDELTNKISEASNNQKPIKPLDLLSSNKFIKKFAANLEQRNSNWRLLYKRSDTLKQLIVKDKLQKIDLKEIIKIYLSFVLQKPGTARSNLKSFISSSSLLIDSIFKKWDLTNSSNYEFFQDIMILNKLYKDHVKDYKNQIANNPNPIERDQIIYDCLANGNYTTLSFIGMIIMYTGIKKREYDFNDMTLLHTKLNFGSFIKRDEFGKIPPTFYEGIKNIFNRFASIEYEKVVSSKKSATNNFKLDDFYKSNLQKYIIENFGAQIQDEIEKIADSIFTSLTFK
jgi:hypothetical protein